MKANESQRNIQISLNDSKNWGMNGRFKVALLDE
jgi:hypothetical protein